MSINQGNEKRYNLTPEHNKLTKLATFLKNHFSFFSKLIVSGLVLYTLFGDFHIGYGSGGTIFHKINNDGSPEQFAKTSDSYVSNLENRDWNKSMPMDYEVESGDTISAIAEKYNIKINAILQANNLTAKSVIKPGQKIALPSQKIDFQVQAVLSSNDSAGRQANNLEDDNRSEKKPFDYEVESGDTLSNIAERYNLKINTILWANNLTAKTIINPGQKIILLPVDGVLHKIKKGETIGEVALLHKADAQKTIDYNEITDPAKIYPGDMIIVPDGQPLPPPKTWISPIPKPFDNAGDNQPTVENPALNLTDKLLWPTPAKRITQGYWSKHRGIDIANGGTPPIFASHDGTVEFAGKSGDWGNTILLRRDDGLVTRYSHASEIYVAIGQTVNTGDTIAQIGTTGRSTGNHLDFRVYVNGVAANPLKLF